MDPRSKSSVRQSALPGAHAQALTIVAGFDNTLCAEVLDPFDRKARRFSELVELVPGAVVEHAGDRLESAFVGLISSRANVGLDVRLANMSRAKRRCKP